MRDTESIRYEIKGTDLSTRQQQDFNIVPRWSGPDALPATLTPHQQAFPELFCKAFSVEYFFACSQ